MFDSNGFTEIAIYFYLPFPWYLLITPMFYAFIVYYLRINDKTKTYLKTTCTIFGIETIIRLTIIVVYADLTIGFRNYLVIEEMVNAIYIIFIFYKTYELVFNKELLLNESSKYDNVKWVKSILKFGIVLIFLWIIAVIYYFFTRKAFIYNPVKILSSALIYWLGYQGLFYSKILNDRILLRKSLEKLSVESTSAKIKLGTNYKNNYKFDRNKIEIEIVEKKQYLDPMFSLERLAEELQMSTSYLSKCLNQYTTHNFADYVNYYRVEHAKKLLLNDAFKKFTILAIGLESGFNSKSTFYTAFKKFTSKTPSDFRNQIID